jgi:hypothetical protein
MWFNIQLLLKMESCSIVGNGPSFVITVIYLNSEDLSIDLSISIYFLQNSSLFLEEVDWWAYIESNRGKAQGIHQEVLFLVFILVYIF